MRAALFALGLLGLLVAPELAAGSVLAYSVTVNADLDKIWKKVQGKLVEGFNVSVEEYRWVKEYKDMEMDPSLRLMEFPVELTWDRGVTHLPEGGREAEPTSVNATDATVSFIHANKRFTIAKLARWAGQADGGRGEIFNQLKWQGKTAMQAIAKNIGFMFWGYSTNYLSQTSTDATQASGTYTLLNAFGDTGIAGTTTAQKEYIISLFEAGDKVALIRAGALVTNGIGTVSAPTVATPSVDIAWAGSVNSEPDDYLVLANGTTATTIAHTSYNRGLVGLLDVCKSTSVHGISSSAVAKWAAAYSDTTAGRFTGQKWRRGLDSIRNKGNANATPVTLMAQGVKRDLIAQLSAGVRFDDTMNMEIDGEPKAKGAEIRSSQRVPPGHVILFDRNKAVGRKTIHDSTESAPTWGSAKELIDDSGYVFGLDWAGYLAYKNRQLFAYWTNQTEL